jgi:hypothetical protein
MTKEEMLIIDIPYRELHLLMDSKSVEKYENCGNTVHKTYIETKNAVDSQTPLIFTTLTHFLSWNYATRLFVHINGEEHELTIGDCEGTTREIRAGHNLEKLLISGEFDWWCD